MDQRVRNRMDMIEKMSQLDAEYTRMSREMAEYERKYNEVLRTLSSAQQDIICDFISQCEGMSWRMLEIACTLMCFP